MLQFALTGRLAADPEHSTYGTDDSPMARLRVASNQPGSETTDFFDVAVFGDNALAALGDAHKGDKIKLTGSGRQHTWTDPSGDRHGRVSLAARTAEVTPRHQAGTDVPASAQTRTATASADR